MADRKIHFDSFGARGDFCPGVEVDGLKYSRNVSSFFGRLISINYPGITRVHYKGLSEELSRQLQEGVLKPEAIPLCLLSGDRNARDLRTALDQYRAAIITPDLRLSGIGPEEIVPGSAITITLGSRMRLMGRGRVVASESQIERDVIFFKDERQQDILSVAFSARNLISDYGSDQDVDAIDAMLGRRLAGELARDEASRKRALRIQESSIRRPFRGFESGGSESSRRKH